MEALNENFTRISDKEFEQAVLGCLLSDTEAITEAMTSGLNAEDFSTPAFRLIFNAVQEIYDSGSMAAVGDVVDILRKRGQLESAGGEEYIKSIPGFAGVKANLGYYTRTLKGCPPVEIDNRVKADDYFKSGQAHCEKGEYELAIADYSEAIKLYPDNDYYYKFRGITYIEKGDYDLAIADSSEAIRLKPNDVSTYIVRGFAYFQKQDYDSAIENYNEAIRHDPNYVSGYQFRCHVYNAKGYYDLAITDYNEVIRLEPYNARAYIDRGIAYCQKQDYDSAIENFTEAISLDFNNASGYYFRGIAYRAKGDRNKAGEDIAKAKELGYELQ